MTVPRLLLIRSTNTSLFTVPYVIRPPSGSERKNRSTSKAFWVQRLRHLPAAKRSMGTLLPNTRLCTLLGPCMSPDGLLVICIHFYDRPSSIGPSASFVEEFFCGLLRSCMTSAWSLLPFLR